MSPTPPVTSICCDESKAPIRMHWFRSGVAMDPMARFREVLSPHGFAQIDIDRFVGEFRSRLIKASQGRLRPASNIKGPLDLITNFELFEIRWTFIYGEANEIEMPVRLYHVEPSHLGSVVVGLHLHEKDVTAGSDIRALQDAQIRIAESNYWAGKGSNWGYRTPSP
jgi:hypothetical protein